MMYPAIARTADGWVTITFPDLPDIECSFSESAKDGLNIDAHLRRMLERWMVRTMASGATPPLSRGDVRDAGDGTVVDVPVPLTLAARIALRQIRVLVEELTLEDLARRAGALSLARLRALEDPGKPLVLDDYERVFQALGRRPPALCFDRIQLRAYRQPPETHPATLLDSVLERRATPIDACGDPSRMARRRRRERGTKGANGPTTNE